MGARRFFAAIRDAWLILGLTLLFFVGLELAYRAVGGITGGGKRAQAADSSQHPYAHEAWWGPFQGSDGVDSRRNRYDPYRTHWAQPSEARYVNVDSLGRRVTVQYGLRGGRQIWMLGGSTMWGYTARDSFSIPSLTARELATRGLLDVEVVNLAQAAYNSTQELNTLELELIRGGHPAVAVFLDGYNDIATAWVNGEAGHTYGDQSVDRQIELGNRGFWKELIGLGRHSAIVQRLQRTLGGAPARGPQAGPEVCGGVASYLRGVIDLSEAVGSRYGFPVRYFLQPVHVASGKPFTAWETSLPKQRALLPCVRALDSALADRKGTTVVPLFDIFDADSTTVFVDQNAHITETANRRVAARIAEVIEPLLQASPPPSP